MEFAVNGSYAPYFFAAALSAALFFLQRLEHVRRRSGVRGASQTANALIDIYCALTAFIASTLGWAQYLLAIYVGYKFGIPAGLLFFGAFFVGGTVLSLVMPPGFIFDVIGHVISIFAAPYLVVLTLRSVSLLPWPF